MLTFFSVQLSVIYYVDSLRSGYYAYGFYQKPCEEGMVQFQRTVEIECQKMFTISKWFALKMTISFHYSSTKAQFYRTSLRVLAYILEQLFAINVIGRKRTNNNQGATFTVGSPRERQPMPGSHISYINFQQIRTSAWKTVQRKDSNISCIVLFVSFN